MRKVIKSVFSKTLARSLSPHRRHTPEKSKLPIFVISFNRRWQLERALASYRQLGNIEIIIHDNGSDEPGVVDYLKELESADATVYRYPKITDPTELNLVNKSVDRYFSSHPKSNYIVTDPDIELLPGAERTLDIYDFLLKKYRDIEAVGPMLKIDDIAPDYPLYNNVLNRHIDQFWGHEPTIIDYKREKIAFLRCRIDTTFAMHRAGQKFKRLTNGMRLYGRYSARHLDWYEKGMLDEPYSKNSSPAIAHWGNVDFHREFKKDKLKYDSYFDVQEKDGEIRVVRKRL
jgi:hypothetical protein